MANAKKKLEFSKVYEKARKIGSLKFYLHFATGTSNWYMVLIQRISPVQIHSFCTNQVDDVHNFFSKAAHERKIFLNEVQSVEAKLRGQSKNSILDTSIYLQLMPELNVSGH